MSSGRSSGSRLARIVESGWFAQIRAAIDRFGEAEVTDRAATLAYYGFLALFPALIVAVSVLALLGSYPETYRSITGTLHDAAPGTAVDLIDSALKNVLRDRAHAGGLFVVGLIVAFVAASGGIAAAIRALEAIERRRGASSLARGWLARLWLTLALMALMLIGFISLVVAGPIFSSIAEQAGLGSGARSAVSMLRYPIGLAALLAGFLLLYWRGPSGSRRAVRRYLPGALLGAGLWVLASVGFSVYVSHFSSYDATYGALGAVIVLLVWLYLGNMAFLLGALFNAERLRAR
jgi:membrane protein